MKTMFTYRAVLKSGGEGGTALLAAKITILNGLLLSMSRTLGIITHMQGCILTNNVPGEHLIGRLHFPCKYIHAGATFETNMA